MTIGFLTSVPFWVTMMIGFLTSFSFWSPAKNDDRISDLNFFLGQPPRMMIGFLTSLSFWVTRQK
jgi:hypothetical protein